MRQLIIIRHAKSDWSHPGLADHDRPLNKRGYRDAPVMGERLARHCPEPDMIITSSAIRARSTAELVAGALAFPQTKIEVNTQIYAASAGKLMDIIRDLPDDQRQVVMVAHNPGVTELVNFLSDSRIDNIPTMGIAILDIDIASWQQLAQGMATLLDFDYPKKSL